MTIIVLKYFKNTKILNIKTNIVYNFQGFFTGKSIKNTIFWKIILNIKDLNKKLLSLLRILIKFVYTYSNILRATIDYRSFWIIS